MLALPLRLPTAPYGGHMGHFLLSMLMLSGSAPFGNMASLSVELNSKYLVQDRPHKLYEDVIPALDLGLWPSEVTNGSFLAEFSIGTAPTTFAPLALAAERANTTIGTPPEPLGSSCGRHGYAQGSTLGWSQGSPHLLPVHVCDPWLGRFGDPVSARVLAPTSIGPANHTAFDLDSKAYDKRSSGQAE